MTVQTQTSWPEWWDTDPQHAQAIYALKFLRAAHWIRDDPEAGWTIDFEGLWEHGPCSSGERILIAHAWCLYNLGWAAVQEEADRARGGDGPIYTASPANAVGTLSPNWWVAYLDMIALARESR